MRRLICVLFLSVTICSLAMAKVSKGPVSMPSPGIPTIAEYILIDVSCFQDKSLAGFTDRTMDVNVVLTRIEDGYQQKLSSGPDGYVRFIAIKDNTYRISFEPLGTQRRLWKEEVIELGKLERSTAVPVTFVRREL